MDCTGYERSISRLRDGELPSDESAGVFLHLSTCGACREFYFTLQTLDGAMNRIAQKFRPDLKFDQRPFPFLFGRTSGGINGWHCVFQFSRCCCAQLP